MADRRDEAGNSPIAPDPAGRASPSSTALEERILLLECRLEQQWSQLEGARAEADLARTRLADAAAREAGYARNLAALSEELAEARAEVAGLHRQLERSEALRAELEGQLFESGAREDAEELVRLRRDLLVERHRAAVNERAAARLRERVEELRTSRETILTRVAEWQQLVRRDGPEAVDLSRYLSELRREILELEFRNASAERREASYRQRLASAGIDPDSADPGVHEPRAELHAGAVEAVEIPPHEIGGVIGEPDAGGSDDDDVLELMAVSDPERMAEAGENDAGDELPPEAVTGEEVDDAWAAESGDHDAEDIEIDVAAESGADSGIDGILAVVADDAEVTPDEVSEAAGSDELAAESVVGDDAVDIDGESPAAAMVESVTENGESPAAAVVESVTEGEWAGGTSGDASVDADDMALAGVDADADVELADLSGEDEAAAVESASLTGEVDVAAVSLPSDDREPAATTPAGYDSTVAADSEAAEPAEAVAAEDAEPAPLVAEIDDPNEVVALESALADAPDTGAPEATIEAREEVEVQQTIATEIDVVPALVEAGELPDIDVSDADMPASSGSTESAAAPEPPALSGATDALVAALAAADATAIRTELRRSLQVCRERDVLEVIRPWTESDRATVRASAYEALGLLLVRNAAALEPFVRAGLSDPDGRVRRRVVLAAAAARGLPLRSLLAQVRVDRDPQVRRVVREILRHAPPAATVAAGAGHGNGAGTGVVGTAGPIS